VAVGWWRRTSRGADEASADRDDAPHRPTDARAVS
jgi:hypothetical protein